jgi:hypothetical protein
MLPLCDKDPVLLPRECPNLVPTLAPGNKVEMHTVCSLWPFFGGRGADSENMDYTRSKPTKGFVKLITVNQLWIQLHSAFICICIHKLFILNYRKLKIQQLAKSTGAFKMK